MLLRDHPLMSYKGVPNWPPTWTWIGGLEDKRPRRGEIGILKTVSLSKVLPANSYLYIDHQGSSYLGSLRFDDRAFCERITEILRFCRNRPVAEIGGLELPDRATGRVDSSSWLSGSPRRDLRTG
jgi:hypothetical protein